MPIDNLGQLVASLFAIVIVIVALAWVLKRMKAFPNQQRSDLSVITSLSLGPKQKVSVVMINGKQVALGITPQSINYLMTLDDPIEQSKAPQSFSDNLKHVMNARGLQ